MLNSSKGTAVQGPRVQADRKRYKAAIHALLDDQPNLQIIEAEAAALHMTDNSVTGLYLADRTLLHAKATVLATGTFLNGKLLRGEEGREGGRTGEQASRYLGQQLCRSAENTSEPQSLSP